MEEKTYTEVVSSNSDVKNATVYHGLNGISQQLYNNSSKLDAQLYRIEKAIALVGTMLAICLTTIAVGIICLTFVIAKN